MQITLLPNSAHMKTKGSEFGLPLLFLSKNIFQVLTSVSVLSRDQVLGLGLWLGRELELGLPVSVS